MMLRTKFPPVFVKSRFFRHHAIIATSLLFGAVISGHCDEIVSSLSNNLQSVSFPTNAWAASSFQAGVQQFILTNVTLSMAQGGPSAGLADVRVFADDAGKPGASLLDLGVQEITGFQSRLWSFTVTNVFTVEAFTTYWIGVGNVSTDQALNVDVVESPPFTFTGAQGAMMTFSGASGFGTGMNPPAMFDPPGPGAALPFQASGTGGAVPEPGPLAFLGIGLVGLFARFQVKRRSA
jgi:hypothetical protein